MQKITNDKVVRIILNVELVLHIYIYIYVPAESFKEDGLPSAKTLRMKDGGELMGRYCHPSRI